MKIASVEIENYRAIDTLRLDLDPSLTVLHGDNAHGKTSLLSAIAVGLGAIPRLLPHVGGIGFLGTDLRRGKSSVRVTLMSTDGTTWRRQRSGPVSKGRYRRARGRFVELQSRMDKIVQADAEGRAVDLPIVAFYDTERAVPEKPAGRTRSNGPVTRYMALQNAFSPRTNFGDFFRWFQRVESDEFREKVERADLRYRLRDLEAVRDAIKAMVPGVSRLRTRRTFARRFVVTTELADGATDELEFDQLSGGYRIVIALAADLARRMVQGNPHREKPLESEAVVLIDEVELHLHPSWQQRILPDLRRAFPNAQFIVSTHSPQVLTAVRPDQIVTLRREDGRIAAGYSAAATFGAEAGEVLSTVMGVGQRPANNEFTAKLQEYMRLVGRDQGESERALTIRRRLEELSPHDSGLDTADIEIRRRRTMRAMRG